MTHLTADLIQVNSVSDMTLLSCVPRVSVPCMSVCSVAKLFLYIFGDQRGCPYGQPKCSKDQSLVVRDDF